MKIVLTDCKTITRGDIDLSVFEKFGQVEFYELTPPELLLERVKDADAILCNKTVISKEIMDGAKKLKYIGLFATGFNNIDVEYAAKKGITVCNAGSYSTKAVAQYVFACIMHFTNKITAYSDFVNDGGWKNSETFSPFVYPIYELAGRKIGIVGYGSIGKEVAKIANALSMEVLVYTRTKKEDASVKFVDLETLVKQSDFVTAHCPLNSQSEKMFNKELFDKFKDGAYFINAARGGVVDETALRDAIVSGKLAGGAVDVLTTEPMTEDCPLFNVENLVVTPHIAWAPVETRGRLLDIVCDNLTSFLNGNPKNKVN